MEITNLMEFAYNKLEKIAVEQTLFLERNIEPRVMNERNAAYFLLYLNQEKEVGGYRYVDKEIYKGESVFYLYDTLPETKGKELQIYPTYFKYHQKYMRIFEITSIATIHDSIAALEFLLTDAHIEVKCLFEVIHPYDFEKEIETSLRILTSENITKSPYVRVINKEQIQSLENFISHQSMRRNDFERVSIYCKLAAESITALKRHYERVRKKLRYYHAEVDGYTLRQLTGIETFYLQKVVSTPKQELFYLDETYHDKVFPLASIGLFDSDGIYLGNDKRLNPVFLDIWKRDKYRTNSNFVILGQSGQGKTTCVRTILFQSHETKQIIIDPEDEYTFDDVLQENYEKIVLDQHSFIVSLFYLQEFTTEDINFLVEHFGLRTGVDYIHQQYYRNFLLDAKEHQIQTIDALYLFALTRNVCEIIVLYLKEISEKQAVIVSCEKRVTHIVVHEQLEHGTLRTSIFLFELLFHIWKIVRQTSAHQTMVILDEGYIFFQKDAFFLINLLRNIYKRIRKYNGSIGLITQNISDFMDYDMKYRLMPIFDNATYKFIFYQGDVDYKILTDILRISEDKKEEIQNCYRGECMLMIGGKSGKLQVKQHV